MLIKISKQNVHSVRQHNSKQGVVISDTYPVTIVK